MLYRKFVGKMQRNLAKTLICEFTVLQLAGNLGLAKCMIIVNKK
jgi:hypothetical protein